MSPKPVLKIDDVIHILEDIIEENIKNNNPLGYFAALYKKVTLKVKEKLNTGYFDDDDRMEKLDVIFAKRYIDAYYNYQAKKPITASWQTAFKLANHYWPIVLQHLLIGMNAHISLDLGIAAAEVMDGRNINELKDDFNKINDILSSLVNTVEEDLASIWPFLKIILKFTRKVDNFLVDFSMEIARKGAWDFAVLVSDTPKVYHKRTIEFRDEKVNNTALLITNPGFIASTIFKIIRLGERKTVADKIQLLME